MHFPQPEVIMVMSLNILNKGACGFLSNVADKKMRHWTVSEDQQVNLYVDICL